MKPIIDPNRSQHRTDKLIALGFNVLHNEIASVTIPMTGKYGWTNEIINIDFSATDENKFIQYAIQQAYNQGYTDGRNNIKSQFQQLIHIDE